MTKRLLILFMFSLMVVPFFAHAQQSCEPGKAGSTLCNAFPSLPGIGGARTQITNIESLFVALFVWVGTFAALLAMSMIIYSGARMIFSQGDPQAVAAAKASLLYSISGFVVMIFGYVIISMVQFFIGVNTGTPDSSFFFNPLNDYQLWAAGDTGSSFVNSIIVNFISLVGMIAMFFIIWNGFKYVLARDNEDQIKKARQGLTWAVFGLIVTILSYTIIQVVIQTIK